MVLYPQVRRSWRRLVLLGSVIMLSLSALALAGPASAAAPVLTSFTPTAGILKQTVTITGTGFTTTTAVRFAGVNAGFTIASSTSIKATVPTTAASGPISVTTANGTAISATSFTVNPGISLSDPFGPPRTTLTVSGSGFSPFEGIDIYLDTTAVVLVGTGSTGSFTAAVQIPGSAAPGSHWVSAAGRHSGLFAQKAFTVRTDWPMRGDGARHHGLNSHETTLDPHTVTGLDESWSARPTGGAVYSSPAIVAGVVYLGANDNRVYALSAATGAVKWSFLTGNWVRSSPAVANGIVYVGSLDGRVYALSASTGAVKWSVLTGGGVDSSPTVADGVVYVGSNDSSVYALDAKTGAERWAYAAGGPVTSSPAVANGVVYFGSSDDVFYALDAANGTLKWTCATTGAIESSPAVAGGIVYFGSDDGRLYAINAATGQLAWYSVLGSPVYGSPAVVNGVVYLGSYSSSEFLALDARTGAQRWFYTAAGAAIGAPAVANGVVYFGSDDGYVYGLDLASGVRLWSAATGGVVRTTPVVVDATVTVGSADGSIYHYTLDAGTDAARPAAADLRASSHGPAVR